MTLKSISLLCLILSLNACATTQNYETALNKEIGKTANLILAKYGAPTEVIQMANGDEIFSYTSINRQAIPSPDYYFDTGFMTENEIFYPFTYGGSEIPIGNFMAETITDYCNTRFYLKNNIVTSWQFKGNACVAP